VSFLPQVPRFAADFWAGAPVPPDQRHLVATGSPQMGQMGLEEHRSVMKRLPESS